jgi:Apea-like HEPN
VGAFWEELSAPEWHWRGLAQLQNFNSDEDLLDLGNGITIRRIDEQDLASMGWTDWHWEQLMQERFRGLLGTHVIATEHLLPKEPENFVANDIVTHAKATRTLSVLRLLKNGDVRIGQMWLHRVNSYYLKLLGYITMGLPTGFNFMMGSPYTLEASELSAVRDLYDVLVRYEDTGDRAPVNVNLALRSFSDVYERRDQWRNDTQLVDAITAAEALLGAPQEATFKVAFRVASVLGNDDDDRVRIYDRMKGYYDTRSAVVHGGNRLYRGRELQEKHRRRLENQQDLRDFVRQLLVGFIRLAVSSDHTFDNEFFEQKLDSALLHSARRSELRLAMGLDS